MYHPGYTLRNHTHYSYAVRHTETSTARKPYKWSGTVDSFGPAWHKPNTDDPADIEIHKHTGISLVNLSFWDLG